MRRNQEKKKGKENRKNRSLPCFTSTHRTLTFKNKVIWLNMLDTK